MLVFWLKSRSNWTHYLAYTFLLNASLNVKMLSRSFSGYFVVFTPSGESRLFCWDLEAYWEPTPLLSLLSVLHSESHHWTHSWISYGSILEYFSIYLMHSTPASDCFGVLPKLVLHLHHCKLQVIQVQSFALWSPHPLPYPYYPSCFSQCLPFSVSFTSQSDLALLHCS